MRIGLFSIIEAGFMLFGVYYLFLFLCEVFSHSTHQPKLGVHQINQGEWPTEIYRGYHYPSIHKNRHIMA